MSTLLECRNLTKRYGGFPALRDVNLTLESGKIIGLLGPNGSGKTTLIKLINGLLTPTMGRVLINGKEPGVESKQSIAYLPDKDYLNDYMRVKDLVGFFADFYKDFDTNRAYQMLEQLQILPQKKLKTLSKGTKEKVQLILTMSRRADLYVLDEPIGGVDPAARDYILNTIISNYEETSSVLISTHLIADIENVLDEVIFIQNGCIRLTSSVDDIRMQEGKSVDALFREVFRC
jgi:ABC-2 type transport system ATP-binding protein